MAPVPQPIPYQGSKRLLAQRILGFLPPDTGVLYEPFAGSGAVTLAAAAAGRAKHYVLSDALAPLIGIWELIRTDPERLCAGYAQLWTAQGASPRATYDACRADYNAAPDPIRLYFLISRCVKNAVRFNADGAFNQSPDTRRIGTHPDRVRHRVLQSHGLLKNARCYPRDYAQSLHDAAPNDVVYMDPPYMGVSGTRDRRYVQGLDLERFIAELDRANQRGVSYIVSFDGRCGDRSYGPGLPEHLKLHHLELDAGRSAQATLSGRAEQTFESLYVAPALLARLGSPALLARLEPQALTPAATPR